MVETMFADLIDGPLAHMSVGLLRRELAPGHVRAAIAHNLLRAAGNTRR